MTYLWWLSNLFSIDFQLPQSGDHIQLWRLSKIGSKNKIEDEFLVDCLVTYIERMIANKIDIDFIIDEFYNMKEWYTQLK